MKKPLILSIIILFSTNISFSQESQPTLEQCLSWLEKNIYQDVKTKKGRDKCDRTISFYYDENSSNAKYLMRWSGKCNGGGGYRFDFSDVDSYELIVTENPYFKILDKNGKYNYVPVLRLKIESKKNKAFIESFKDYGETYSSDLRGNIKSDSEELTVSKTFTLRHFDTYEQNQDNYASSNIYEVKKMFTKVIDRIIKLSAKKSAKSIDSDWFKD